ncbi:MAG TPA: hypothetical protein DD434_12565 [Bacteroidales bacterium]|nr:hypothetical protein [Bacteroidales bacterium]
MKRICLALVIVLISVSGIQAQSKMKSFFSGGINAGFISNLNDFNNSMKTTFSDYDKEHLMQASIGFGVGRYFGERFTAAFKINYALGNNLKDEQALSLYGGNFELNAGYSFLKREEYELEANVGGILSFDNLVYNREYLLGVHALSFSSMNVFIPVKVYLWTYYQQKNKKEKVGVYLGYNIPVYKSNVYYSGLDIKADVGKFASNSLWAGVEFRI